MESLWQYSTIHNCACKVLEEQTLWGKIICSIWLPNQNIVLNVPKSSLTPVPPSKSSYFENHHIRYLASAAKVAEVVESRASVSGTNVLLAPMESNVIPLPHQINALSRAITGDRIRYLLADEVGLGKTIEAGLILRELKLKGDVHRTLVLTPKSLARQWVAEMSTHFSESFTFVNPLDLEAAERLENPGNGSGNNPWLRFSQVIVTQDAVKPLTRRKGWTKERINTYNLNRFQNLVHGNWDLIIVDEAHRMGGSSEQVARFKLGQGLAEASPYLLLLSATPHQGKSDAFQRLMSLLDPMTFPDSESITRDRVANFVIRTEKRKALDSRGNSLFLPRTTQTIGVDFTQYPQQIAVYERVTEYVKEGYNRAIKDKKPHIGFLMVLLQRITTSSTCAIIKTLERRLQVLEELCTQIKEINEDFIEELTELDGQEQLDALVEISSSSRIAEIKQVKYLLQLAKAAESKGPDAKTQVLYNLILDLQGTENDIDLKVLVFTEFVATQEMLLVFLESRGISCTILNGSMSLDERQMAQDSFREKCRILISTDAGGEGLNLQFCHVVVNYDLPWNPMRIEQRIGRVDRIGQAKMVKAVNLIHENSVENRVREVLELKLALILHEIGIDKMSDVLDSSLSGSAIEQMLTNVIMLGADPEVEVEKTVNQLKNNLLDVKTTSPIFQISDEPNMLTVEKIRNHPLPDWIETMTTNFLQWQGCNVHKSLFGWDLSWPSGQQNRNVVFTYADGKGKRSLLTLEDSHIRDLVDKIPQFLAGQPIPNIHLPDLPISLSGNWGLFEISIHTALSSKNPSMRIPIARRRYFPVFLSDLGELFLPTARHIWDGLLTSDFKIHGFAEINEAQNIADLLLKAVEESGLDVYNSLHQEHLAAIQREEERGRIAFSSRRKAIDRIGLPEVRQHRQALSDAEEAEWRKELESSREIVPDIRPLLLAQISQGGSNG